MQSKTPNHNIQNDTKKAVKQGHTTEYQNSFRKKKNKKQTTNSDYERGEA